MGRFTVVLRSCFHALQLGGAVAACAIYASNYDGLIKDYRWKYAITTGAFSIVGTVIQASCIVTLGEDFDEGWIVLSGICSGILFLFWTGALGTFARSFIHRDPNYSHGIRMMQVAVYIDAANMVIWFLTVAYMIGMLVQYNSTAVASRRRNAEELRRLQRPSSSTFVPYGWDTVDLEAQTSYATVDMYEAHLNPPNPVLPAPHLPTHFRETEGAESVYETLPMLPDEVQHYPPIPPATRSPDRATLHSLTRESQPYPSSPQFSLQYRRSLYRPVGYPTPSDRPLSKYSWPLSLEEPEPTMECPICIEEHPCYTGFPSRIARACKSHEQEACRDCVAKTIAAELDNNISGQIHCYKCRAVLEYEEVKTLADPLTFERYEAMGLRSFVSNNPNFVWCQSPHCEAGQEHVGGIDQPIVTCQACGFKTCFKHQIPWHENMLCDEYDERLPLADNDQRLRAQQEAASIAAVHEVTKPCANKACRAPIQKNMGCDHMTCRACKHEFCWVCGANWGGVHLPGCGHR